MCLPQKMYFYELFHPILCWTNIKPLPSIWFLHNVYKVDKKQNCVLFFEWKELLFLSFLNAGLKLEKYMKEKPNQKAVKVWKIKREVDCLMKFQKVVAFFFPFSVFFDFHFKLLEAFFNGGLSCTRFVFKFSLTDLFGYYKQKCAPFIDMRPHLY